jgi:membrane protease YdiL (CAAX protease family)
VTVDLGFSRLALGPITGVGAFLLLAGGRLPFSLPRPLGRAMVVRWLVLGATAGLEEVVWRGIVLGGLLILVGPWPALAVSSAGFAVWHWPSLRGRCAVHIVTGTAFGCAFLAGGLVAAMLGHALYNLLVDWAVHAERVRVRSRSP